LLHSDIIPEHERNGELIDVSETKYVTKTWVLEVWNQELLPSRFNVGDHRPAGNEVFYVVSITCYH
jgi:hypothetical protein